MTIGLAIAAALMLWAGGYLFGVRRGKGARDTLAAVAETARGEAAHAAARLDAAQDAMSTARAELRAVREASERSAAEAARNARQAEKNTARAVRAAVADARREGAEAAEVTLAALRDALAESHAEQRALRTQFEALLDPLNARDGEAQRRHVELEARISERLAEQGDELLRRLVSEAIGPLQERTGALGEVVANAIRPLQVDERVTTDLANLHVGSGRGDLNRLLSSIAGHAGFALVVLSDAQGLLLANSHAGSRNAEVRAGLSALVLTITDSSAQIGAPLPLSVTVHDTENQIIVTRIFEVDGERFLLTAVSKGRFVQPNVLDPALSKIETLMEDWAAAQLLPAAAEQTN